MNLGAFAVIIAMRRRDLIGDEIDDLSGLMARAPGMAVLMLIFLLSLAGIPPTAGFIGKYYIFLSLIQTGHYYLAVLAVGYAVVALYYYFRIVVVMFMKKAPDAVPLAIGPGLKVALAVSVSATLVIGIVREKQSPETTTRHMLEMEQSNIRVMLDGRGQYPPIIARGINSLVQRSVALANHWGEIRCRHATASSLKYGPKRRITPVWVSYCLPASP